MESTLKTKVLSIIRDEARLDKEMKLHRSRRQLYEKEIRQLSTELHTTRDGTIILIADMENSHLMNLM